jgi:hypothetical protein
VVELVTSLTALQSASFAARCLWSRRLTPLLHPRCWLCCARAQTQAFTPEGKYLRTVVKFGSKGELSGARGMVWSAIDNCLFVCDPAGRIAVYE